MSYEANIQEMEHLTGKITVLRQIDKTLTKEGHAADAKAAGDAIRAVERRVNTFETPGADKVTYSNEKSGLSADNMQDAVDEIASEYLSKNGNIVVNGSIASQRFKNGHGRLNKNHSETVDYGTQIVDEDKNGKSASINVSALYNTFTYVDPSGNIRDVFHEGNKPFGNYAGNGDATERTIATGGIGRLILVYNIYYFSFVTPEGALVITLADGSIRWIESTKAFFLNGNLTLATDNAAFNEADTTYYYQVI